METELFETRITQQGRKVLLRIHFWAKLFYLGTAISCVFDLIVAYHEFGFFFRDSGRYPPTWKFYRLFNLIYLVLYAFLLPLMGYFFYRFSSGSKKGLTYGDADELDYSLRWLNRHIVIAASLFAVNSLWAMTNVYFLVFQFP